MFLTAPTQKSADAHATLMISVGPQEFVLANFNAKSQTQTALDLFFAPGMDVFFSVHGNASVHLVGYVTVSSFDAGADGGEGEGLSDMEEQEGDDKEDERLPPSNQLVVLCSLIVCSHHEPAARASGRRRRRG